jgi:hypothetical protein
MHQETIIEMPEEMDPYWDDVLKILWHERSVFRGIFDYDYDNHFNKIYSKYLHAKQAGNDPLWYWRVADVPDVYLNLDPWNSLLIV